MAVVVLLCAYITILWSLVRTLHHAFNPKRVRLKPLSREPRKQTVFSERAHASRCEGDVTTRAAAPRKSSMYVQYSVCGHPPSVGYAIGTNLVRVHTIHTTSAICPAVVCNEIFCSIRPQIVWRTQRRWDKDFKNRFLVAVAREQYFNFFLFGYFSISHHYTVYPRDKVVLPTDNVVFYLL